MGLAYHTFTLKCKSMQFDEYSIVKSERGAISKYKLPHSQVVALTQSVGDVSIH